MQVLDYAKKCMQGKYQKKVQMGYFVLREELYGKQIIADIVSNILNQMQNAKKNHFASTFHRPL